MQASLLSSLCLAAIGCSIVSPDRVRTQRQPAYIRFYQDPPLLQAPDTVDAGVAFTITVRTFGGGCIDQGDTDTSIVGRTVELHPFDVFTTHLPRNYVCPEILRYYSHTAMARFDRPGSATIRAFGRASPGDTLTILERTIVVR